MKLQDTVFSSLKAANLPSSIVSYLHNVVDEYEEYPIKGGLLKDIRYGWLASRSKFAVVNLKTSQKIAAWNFGTDLREYDSKITTVCELPTPLTTTGKQLLVGLECNIIGGMVCLFHCDGSRILRAIQMDCKVTCLTALDEVLMGPLSCFDGTVLVGTQGGALLAFDLNRQRCFEAISHSAYGNDHLIRDERNMARLAVLSLDDISVIDEQRAIACNRDDHIAVQLNEGCFHGKQFYLYNPDSTVRFQSSRDEVFISQMLYVPQLVSMIVGFSYGAFQIWNLLSTELDFTSQVSAECLPITQLAFQEPSDDPCAFSYLWVIYSAIDKYDDGYPIAAMYSLRYQAKKVINNALCLYQDFSKCTLRFQIELTFPEFTNISINNLIGGRGITCHSISKTVTNKSDDTDDTIINICQISWECWQANRQTPAVTYMVLFDLDQWYKEHMPESSKVETNSFMSFVNLTPCITNNSNSHFCDMKLDVTSLSQFSSVQKLEEHYYPNSYAYDCTCLVSVESVWISTLGVQRQLLSTLNSLGPSVLLNPARIYKQCINVGLVPLYFDVPPGIAPLSVQRALVLSVALAARLWRLLLRCARESPVSDASDDADAHSSLPPLVEWAWSRAATLRSAAHTLTRPLWVPTMLSGAQSCGIKSGPDRNSLCLLRECTAQLASLDSLFGAVLENTVERLGLDMTYNITQRKNAVHMVSLYFKVIQWFIDVGLLPEYHLDEDLHLLNGSVQRLPYPIDTLIRSYQNRRCQLFRLQGTKAETDDMQLKSCPLLFIDQLIDIECSDDKLRRVWKDDGSTTDGLYPPPSLHSLLKVYLQPEILEDTKHSLILYTLEDYAMVFGERYSDAIRRLMQFPTVMEMSNTNIKITQAFWHLDHRCFDFALEQLWGLCTSNGSCERWSWVQNAVVASLTAQRRAQVALQWLAGSGINKGQQLADDDMAVDMETSDIQNNSHHKGTSAGSLYLARRSPEAAIGLLRYSNPQRQDYLHFFNECKRIGLLSKISKIPLTKQEEDFFISFLRRSKDPHTMDILIMFYLQRARYAEALSVKYSEKEPNAETWSLLVQMYCSGIPTLATLTSAAPSTSGDMADMSIKVTEPIPMSVFVEPKTPQPVTYKSSLIQSVITRASETWMEKPALSRGLKRALEPEDTPFICTPKIRRTGRSFLTELTVRSDDSSMESDSVSQTTKPRVDQITPQRTKFTLSSQYSTPALESDLQSMLYSPAVERDARWNSHEPLSPERLSMRDHTPQSILKVRKLLHRRDDISPNDLRYFGETDEELETSSQHTQHSDTISLARSIRFTMPYGDENDRETTPISLSEDTFIDENKTHCISIQSQIESATNYNLPRKKFATISEDEVRLDTNKRSPQKNLPDRNSRCASEIDDAFYSPNESIADIIPEMYSTSGKILHSDQNDDSLKRLWEKATSAETSLESVEAYVMQSGDEYLPSSLRFTSRIDVDVSSAERSPTKTDMESPPSILGSPASSEKTFDSGSVITLSDSFDSSTEDIAKVGPRPRRSIRVKSVEAVEIPLRRSSRSRSQTPELESSVQTAPRPRARTPTIKTSKARKSLSRQVLEANTFIKRDTATSTDPSTTTGSRQTSEIIGCSILTDVSPSTSIAMSSICSDNVISTPIAQFKLSVSYDSILDSCSSISPQNTSDVGAANNVPSKMYSHLNLPDLSESILSSDTSDIFQNNSEYAPTLDVFEIQESEHQTSVQSKYAAMSTPIMKCNPSAYHSILSSDTSNSLQSTPGNSDNFDDTSTNRKAAERNLGRIEKENQQLIDDSVKFSLSSNETFTSLRSEKYNKKSIEIKSILQDETLENLDEIKSNRNVSRNYIDNTVNKDLKMDVDDDNIYKYKNIVGENLNIEFDDPAESISSSCSNRSQTKGKDNDEKLENFVDKEAVNLQVIDVDTDNEEEFDDKVASEEEVDEEEADEEEADEEEVNEEEVDEEEIDEELNPEENVLVIESMPKSEMGDEEIGSEASKYTSDEEISIPNDESSKESSSDEISRNILEPDVISVSNSSSDSTLVDAPNREGGKTKPDFIVNIEDASEIQISDSEPPILLTLNSSISEDDNVLQTHRTDPYLQVCEFETASSTNVRSEKTYVSEVTTVSVEFSNYSILTDDDSFVEDHSNVTLQPNTTIVESEPKKSHKVIESPVKVVVTDTEGRSTIEIEEYEGISNVSDIKQDKIAPSTSHSEIIHKVEENIPAEIGITDATYSEGKPIVEIDDGRKASNSINRNKDRNASSSLAEVIHGAEKDQSTNIAVINAIRSEGKSIDEIDNGREISNSIIKNKDRNSPSNLSEFINEAEQDRTTDMEVINAIHSEGKSTVEIDAKNVSDSTDKNKVEIAPSTSLDNSIYKEEKVKSTEMEITNTPAEMEHIAISDAVKRAEIDITPTSFSDVTKKADKYKSTEVTPNKSEISALIIDNSDNIKKIPNTRNRRGSTASEDKEDKYSIKKPSEHENDSSVISNIPKSPSRRKSPVPERLTRSRAKSVDTESIASNTSFADSNNSGDSVSLMTRSKSRKSILPTKADLFVIPEDGSSKLDITEDGNESSLADYSMTRRLTRNQRALLDKSAKTAVRKIVTRRSSATSVASVAGSDVSESGSDIDRSFTSIASVETIDPISLLDLVGVTGRTSRAASDSAIEPIKRTRRASAEIASPVRITRRSSVDVSSRMDCESPIEFHTSFALDSPSTPGSSGRPRRQSFTKAIEALHQPRKGRRLSTDSKPDDNVNTSGTSSSSKIKIGTDDMHVTSVLEPVLEDDEAKTTPVRRTRRAASEASNTSTTSVESKTSSRRLRTGSTAKM